MRGQNKEVGTSHEANDVALEAKEVRAVCYAEIEGQGWVRTSIERARNGEVQVGNVDEGTERRVEVFDGAAKISYKQAEGNVPWEIKCGASGGAWGEFISINAVGNHT